MDTIGNDIIAMSKRTRKKETHSPHSWIAQLKTRCDIYRERTCIFVSDLSVCAIKSVPNRVYTEQLKTTADAN